MPIPFAAIGSAIGAGLNLLRNNKTDKLQEDFAKKGIQWKVKDAIKAGVHPLYALGANTVSYSPTTVGDMSANLSDMGQNIDRARMATSEAPARGVAAVIAKLSLERAGLENDLLRAQIAQVSRPHVGPAMPSVFTTATNQPWPVNPKVTSAQDWENQYHEIGGFLGGTDNLLRDAGTQFRRYIFGSDKVQPLYRTRNYSRPNPAVRR